MEPDTPTAHPIVAHLTKLLSVYEAGGVGPTTQIPNYDGEPDPQIDGLLASLDALVHRMHTAEEALNTLLSASAPPAVPAETNADFVPTPLLSPIHTLPVVSASTSAPLSDAHFNEVKLLKTQIQDVSRVCSALARGDFTQKVAVAADGDMLELKHTLNFAVDQCGAVAAEISRVAIDTSMRKEFGEQISVPNAQGTWRDVITKVNTMSTDAQTRVTSLTGTVHAFGEIAHAIAIGDLSKPLNFGGSDEETEPARDSLYKMTQTLRSFTEGILRMAVGGREGPRLTAGAFEGEWKRAAEGVNLIADKAGS